MGGGRERRNRGRGIGRERESGEIEGEKRGEGGIGEGRGEGGIGEGRGERLDEDKDTKWRKMRDEG